MITSDSTEAVEQIVKAVADAFRNALTGGDLHTVDHVSAVLPPAEAQRAKDLAVKLAQKAKADEAFASPESER